MFDRDSMSSYMPHGPLMHPSYLVGCCMHAHALFTLLGANMGVFNALERLIVDYRGNYRW